MSKAEDKLENNRLKYIDYTFKRHGIDPDSKEGQLIYYAYGHGYHQAEKDLELTWEDIAGILDITDVIANDDSMEECLKTMSEEEYCQEVLKRFKDFKKGKMEAKDSTCASEDLDKAAKEWLIPQLDKSYANYGERKMMELTRFDGYAMLEAIEFGANWMLNKITKQDKNKED